MTVSPRVFIARRIMVAAIALLCLVPASAPDAADTGDFRYGFTEFPANAAVHDGKVRLPDFNGRDAEHRMFRTRIREGMQAGAEFDGEYAVIQVGCGTACQIVFFGNVRTGEVFDFPLGGEKNSALNLGYRIDSSLVIARWQDYDRERCIYEYFTFDQGNWRHLASENHRQLDVCYDYFDEKLPK